MLNRWIVVSALLAASCGNVTPATSGAAGAAGGELGGAGGAAGQGAAGQGAAGQGAAGGELGGAGGAAGQGAAGAPPACAVGAPAWSLSASWCGRGCAACPSYAAACTFPSVTVTDADAHGSTATCNLDTLAAGSTGFTLTEAAPASAPTWTLNAALTPANYCKTVPAFVCAPTCAACP